MRNRGSERREILIKIEEEGEGIVQVFGGKKKKTKPNQKHNSVSSFNGSESPQQTGEPKYQKEKNKK